MSAGEKPALYSPQAYVARDPRALVQRYPFATLLTNSSAGIFATSTPLFFETDSSGSTLVGHLARRNGHAANLHAGQQALAIFNGPHTYVSSSWYETRPTVPTWDYVVAHVRGTIEPLDDDASQLAILRLTAAVLEAGSDKPWTLEQAPEGTVQRFLPMIRSFRLHIESIEGVTKLSQRQPAPDRLRIIRRLLDRGDGNSTEIARLMAHLQPTE